MNLALNIGIVEQLQDDHEQGAGRGLHASHEEVDHRVQDGELAELAAKAGIAVVLESILRS
jgi:hypothetical protein